MSTERVSQGYVLTMHYQASEEVSKNLQHVKGILLGEGGALRLLLQLAQIVTASSQNRHQN